MTHRQRVVVMLVRYRYENSNILFEIVTMLRQNI